jgi:hypothetical protein
VLRIARRRAPHVVAALAPTTAFPALTLGHSGLGAEGRTRLAAAGIHSGLDLVDLKAVELAEILGIGEDQARDLRLRAFGLRVR